LQRIEINNSWFEAYRVAPGVTAIYEPFQWQETISYLIEGKDKALLFDTGNGISSIKSVVDSLTSKPLVVLNSHTHYDHVGGNFEFTAVSGKALSHTTLLGMDTAFTRARQGGVANEDIRIEVSPQALCRDLPEGVSEQNHTGRPFKISAVVDDGALIDLGDRVLQVLHVPGHTPDAIALIDRTAGLMWTGDTYYSGPIWLYAPETNLRDYRQSLEKLSDHLEGIRALLPAHNTPWVDPQVLGRVKNGFELLLAGKLKAESRPGGIVTYEIPDETEFSFLLREGMLPLRPDHPD
jgi:glyoxylase-like metal-dependent hydrolase (beta-lactamase superfamily II)